MKLLVACAVLLLLVGSASAGLVTASPGGTVVTLDQFGGIGYNFTSGPVDVGALVGQTIIFTSTWSSVLGQGSYGLAGNGSWGGSMVYAGLDTGTGYMQFVFSTPLSEVGAFLNYAPGAGSAPTIYALDSGGTVLESYDLSTAAPISTPGGFNAGAYRGISRIAGDIYGFRVANSYIVADDIEFSSVAAPVPEPSTIALFGLGAGLLAAGARLRSRRAR